MKSLCLLLICILWSISATDVNISCVHCVGETEKSCHGDLKECSSVTDQCISVFEEAKVDMKTSSLFMRFCGDCSQQKTGFVRFHNGILKINATCCNTSNCNPSVPTVPRDEPIKYINVKKTGKICNSCYTYEVRKCDCKIYMECIEGEHSCISRYISAIEPHDHSGAVRGCTTTKMCKITNSTASIRIGRRLFVVPEAEHITSCDTAGMRNNTLPAAAGNEEGKRWAGCYGRLSPPLRFFWAAA